MSEVFLKVVNMSISAGWLVLAVLAFRLVLKKAPRWVHVLLWGIVAVRLICPVFIESAFSLIPSTETISPEIMMDWTPEISTGIEPLDQVVNPVISTSFAPEPIASVNPLQILIPVAAIFWLMGAMVMLLYTGISYLILRRKLRMAVIVQDNIFQCEAVQSPFVLGILNPKIYLPYTLDGQDLNHVVAHEQAHISRRDHWWKPFGFLLLTVHWFNPLMWVAYILLCRDIELACDEKVIAQLGNEQRADYTQALVECSVNRHTIAACPLAFGEVGVKERVKSIMNYRRPTFWLIVLAMAAIVMVAICFLTDPLERTIYDIYRQDGYTVLDQREIGVTLYVEKSKLPDAIYTSEGYDFDEDEVIVHSTHTSRIFLDKVMLSNESDDLLYFCFDFSYDLPKAGSIITPFAFTGENDGMKTSLNLRSRDLRDTNTTYAHALAIRGHGPGTKFDFYVSKEACMAANGTLAMDIVCSELVYAKEGHGYETQSVTENQTVMQPTQTNLRGLVAGYLFTPIDGATYRYALTETKPSNVTVDKLLDTFTEQTYIEGIVWQVYSLKEYPDKTKLLMISGINSAWLCEYAPAKQAEEGALQAVKEAGYVVEEDGRLTSGKEAWEDFYEAAQKGTPGFIRVAHYFTLDPDRTVPSTYEAYEQDYPALYISELSYDGEVFVLRTEENVMVYEYLMKYTGRDHAVSTTQADEYTRYVLTHDNTVTWEQLWNGLFSSAYGAYIDHYTVCTELN